MTAKRKAVPAEVASFLRVDFLLFASRLKPAPSAKAIRPCASTHTLISFVARAKLRINLSNPQISEGPAATLHALAVYDGSIYLAVGGSYAHRSVVRPPGSALSFVPSASQDTQAVVPCHAVLIVPCTANSSQFFWDSDGSDSGLR